MHSFGHKTHSFRHMLKSAANQKSSLTKVVQLYNATEEMLPED